MFNNQTARRTLPPLAMKSSPVTSTGFYKILNMICSGTFQSALKPRLLQLLPNLLHLGTLFYHPGVDPLICLCSISSATGSGYTATPEQLATLSEMLSSMSGRPTPAATPGANVFGLIHHLFTYSNNSKPVPQRCLSQTSSPPRTWALYSIIIRNWFRLFFRIFPQISQYPLPSTFFNELFSKSVMPHSYDACWTSSYLLHLSLNLARPNLERPFQTLTRPFERVSSVVSSGLLVSQKKLGLGWDHSWGPYRNMLIENGKTVWIQTNGLFCRYLRISCWIFLNEALTLLLAPIGVYLNVTGPRFHWQERSVRLSEWTIIAVSKSQVNLPI